MSFFSLGIFVVADHDERKRHRKTLKAGHSMPFLRLEMFLV